MFMTSNPQSETQGKFTGTHMLLVMLAFFGTIIAVNLSLLFFSTNSWTGLVVKNSYVASQNFNKNIEAQEQMLARGWRGELNYKSGRFEFTLKEKDAPLADLNVTGLLRRPVHENEDVVLNLTATGDGRYEGFEVLKPGMWEVEVIAKDGPDASFKQIFRFVVPKTK